MAVNIKQFDFFCQSMGKVGCLLYICSLCSMTTNSLMIKTV